ncbi:glycosyltransferase [Weissella paramesenteroides]|uniref:glycosyltransferase n=1 Tax=Weissella paramesenteroides TaxID=1249 RepID=UPI003D36E65B
MLKILIFGVTPAQGGIETFVLNVCKVTQGLAKVYLYNFSDSEVAYQNTFKKKYGVNIFNIITKRNIIGHMTRKFQYKNFFKHHKFDIVHINANSPSNYDFAQEALRSGAKVIYHSHNDSSESFVLNKKAKKIINIVRAYQRFRLNRLSISRVAVSQDAAKWMFGKKENVSIVPNGVDFSKFEFSNIKREQRRMLLNIDLNDIVLLTASRLTKQKNFNRILTVANLALTKGSVDHVVIIGDGDQMSMIQQFRSALPADVKSRIHIMGAQNDMQSWYSLADLLLMPSLYEGLPYSILEAQANGLNCFISTAIPKQAVINSKLMHFHSKEDTDLLWINDIEKHKKQNINRDLAYKKANQSPYSLTKFKLAIENLYNLK